MPIQVSSSKADSSPVSLVDTILPSRKPLLEDAETAPPQADSALEYTHHSVTSKSQLSDTHNTDMPIQVSAPKADSSPVSLAHAILPSRVPLIEDAKPALPQADAALEYTHHSITSKSQLSDSPLAHAILPSLTPLNQDAKPAPSQAHSTTHNNTPPSFTTKSRLQRSSQTSSKGYDAKSPGKLRQIDTKLIEKQEEVEQPRLSPPPLPLPAWMVDGRKALDQVLGNSQLKVLQHGSRAAAISDRSAIDSKQAKRLGIDVVPEASKLMQFAPGMGHEVRLSVIIF